MKARVQRAVNGLLGHAGLSLVRRARLEALIADSAAARDLALLQSAPRDQAALFLDLLPHARAQLRQDLFVCAELGFKRGGYFVEFGATNGVDLSNTCLLERQLGWRGILAEPARCWHAALAANRTCHVTTACVWSASGARLTFNEAIDAKFSTIDTHSATDLHRESRRDGTRYEVDTISLNDLLDRHDAPEVVDYLSIDTEGSEYDILAAFDFGRRRFRVITCEHNFSPARSKIHALLTGHGYVRRHEAFSQFDDWYVLPGA